MRDGLDPKTRAFFKMKNHGSVFGDRDFIDKIKETYVVKDKKNSPEIPEKRKIEGEMAIKRIKSEVIRFFKMKESGLYSSIRGEYNKPRSMALGLSRELSGLKLQEIAKHYKIRSYKTVSSSCQRFKMSLAYDKTVWREYDNLRRGCIQEET